MERGIKILNSTFEVALRLLAIMTTCKKAMTVERLTAYSYFAIYLSDLDDTQASLHPEIPYRNSNYINSEGVILSAIDWLLSKGIVACVFSNRSIKYSATELGIVLYEQIQGSYKTFLGNNILKAHNLVKGKSDSALRGLIYGKMAEWGSEFNYESVFRGFEYEE